MNSQEARRLLEVFRPSGADAGDPRFAEALEVVKRDPELARWFDEQRQFDARIAGSLQRISPPVDLRGSILAGGKVVRPPFWQVWGARAAVAAAVAALAVAAGVFASGRSTRFPEFRKELVEQAWNGESHLNLESSDIAQIKQWLASHGADADFMVPVSLAETRVHGCRIVVVAGRRVPMLCLADGPKHLHLFVVNRADFAELPPQGAPDFEKCGAWKTASWRQGDKTYVLTGMKYQTFVSKFRKAGRWTLSG